MADRTLACAVGAIALYHVYDAVVPSQTVLQQTVLAQLKKELPGDKFAVRSSRFGWVSVFRTKTDRGDEAGYMAGEYNIWMSRGYASFEEDIYDGPKPMYRGSGGRKYTCWTPLGARCLARDIARAVRETEEYVT